MAFVTFDHQLNEILATMFLNPVFNLRFHLDKTHEMRMKDLEGSWSLCEDMDLNHFRFLDRRNSFREDGLFWVCALSFIFLFFIFILAAEARRDNWSLEYIKEAI
jgi:hypothetical protein